MFKALVAAAAVLLLAVVSCVVAQPYQQIVYQYSPRPSDNLRAISPVVNDMDTGRFWIVYDDLTLGETFVQVVDPFSTARTSQPASLTGIGVTPGTFGTAVQPILHGMAGIVGAQGQGNNNQFFGYYNVSAGTVTPFPGQNLIALTFGNQEPSWNNAAAIANGWYNVWSQYVYVLGGCSATAPNQFSISQFNLMNPNPTTPTWTTAIYSASCDENWALQNFMAYEENVWFVDNAGNLINLNTTNGGVLLNMSNPCFFALTPQSPMYQFRFIQIGWDQTQGNFGIPLYALLLSHRYMNDTVEICRYSHRTPYHIEWRTYSGVLGPVNMMHSAGPNTFVLYSEAANWTAGNTQVASRITFINPTTGAEVESFLRPPVDYQSYPSPLNAPIGTCANPVVVQFNGVLQAYCTDTMPSTPLWVSDYGCWGLPIDSPFTNVLACPGPNWVGLILISTVDGSLIWQDPTIASPGRPYVSEDMVWYYQNQGILVGASLQPATTPGPSTNTGSSPSSGVSSGTAAAVSILMLVVGAVLGIAVYVKFFQQGIRRSTYAEVQPLQ